MSNSDDKNKPSPIGEGADVGDSIFHPITLQFIKNESKSNNILYPTEFFDDGFEFRKARTLERNYTLQEDTQQFMVLPYLNITLDTILNLYKVNSIDDLVNWVNIRINENTPFKNVNRIINIWIKNNFNIIRKNNNIFNKIYLNIYRKYWSNFKIKNEDIENIISKYIDSWVSKKDIKDFKFDLGNDLKKHLKILATK